MMDVTLKWFDQIVEFPTVTTHIDFCHFVLISAALTRVMFLTQFLTDKNEI